MLARKSTHKRKRSSSRADASRTSHPSRCVANWLPGQHADSRLDSLIQQHPFNYTLELLLPFYETSQHSQEQQKQLVKRLQSLTQEQRFSACRARVPLALFLDPIFVSAYIKNGQLTALSAGAIDAQDVVCLDGQGTLVLSLTKDTYQTLGLTGRASHFSRMASGRSADRTSGKDTRYIVELPLASPSFVPGKKGYKQALECLRRWDASRCAGPRTVQESHLVSQMHNANVSRSASSSSSSRTGASNASWDMLFSWTPTDDSVPSVIQLPSYQVDASSVEAIQHVPTMDVIRDVWIPELTGKTTSSSKAERLSDPLPGIEQLRDGWSRIGFEEWALLAQETLEWAGLVSLGSDAVRTYTRPDNFCVYQTPTPCTAGSVLRMRWKGLLPNRLVSLIAAETARLRDSQGWAALTCTGYSDAPVAWRSKVALSSRTGTQSEAPAHQGEETRSESESELDDGSTSSGSSGSDGDCYSEEEPRKSITGPAARRRRAKRVKRRGHVRKNEAEHGFTLTGHNGWTALSLGGATGARWILVENMERELRS